MINIANATVTEKWRNGVFYGYAIAPNDGYILHDKVRDWEDIVNFDTMETVLKRGYTTGDATCGASYDFAVTTTIDGYTAYGDREFFARPASEVPGDQIFGVGNDHEVM